MKLQAAPRTSGSLTNGQEGGDLYISPLEDQTEDGGHQTLRITSSGGPEAQHGGHYVFVSHHHCGHRLQGAVRGNRLVALR